MSPSFSSVFIILMNPFKKLNPFPVFSGPFHFASKHHFDPIVFILFSLILITYKDFLFWGFCLVIYSGTYVSARWMISCLSSRLFSVCFLSPCHFSSRCGQKEGRDVTWRLRGCLLANRELQSEEVKGCQGWRAAAARFHHSRRIWAKRNGKACSYMLQKLSSTCCFSGQTAFFCVWTELKVHDPAQRLSGRLSWTFIT